MQPIVLYIIAGCHAAALLTLQALSLASLRRMKRLVEEKPEKKEHPETTKSIFADILELEDIDLLARTVASAWYEARAPTSS